MPALFSFDEITKADTKNWISIENAPEMCCTDLKEIIDNVAHNQLIAFNSAGKFSLYDLVEGLVNRFDIPSSIYLSTYGVSEPAIRRLANMKHRNQLETLYCVLDHRVAQRQPKAFALLSSIADEITYQESHAKITCIENDEFCITILGSQNWTRNTKYEAGVLLCSRTITNFYKNYISALFDDR